MSVTHHLKVDPAMFARLYDGSKTFEVRKDDRGYQTGDVLVLWRYDRAKCHYRHSIDQPKDRDNCPAMYPRQSLEYRIGFIFKQGYGCDLGQYVVLSLLPVEADS